MLGSVVGPEVNVVRQSVADSDSILYSVLYDHTHKDGNGANKGFICTR